MPMQVPPVTRLPPREWDTTSRILYPVIMIMMGWFAFLLYVVGAPVLAGMTLVLWSAAATLAADGDRPWDPR
jgi:hypothetical protein